MVDPQGGDRFGLGLAGLGVGGEDLVTSLDIIYRDVRSVCEADIGCGGEALLAAGCSG